jgi:tripartite-type tricarboxylate transporter receptor subunit TctC
MKQIITLLFLAWSTAGLATETITIASTYNAGHSGQAALLTVLDTANKSQNKYNFILENRPGAQGLIALNYVSTSPQNRLALVAAGVVDNFVTGKAKETDFVPVHAIGDACWAVVTNWPADEKKGLKSISRPVGARDLVIGAVGIGSVSHLTGLEVATFTNNQSITVVFKSGSEALMNLASGNGVNITIDNVTTVTNMQSRVSNLSMVATTCKDRHPQALHVPTLTEQGLGNIPPVFNIILSSAEMTANKRKELGDILDQATMTVGLDKLFASSGFKAAVFQKLTAQQFYNLRTDQIKALRKKYSDQINESAK